MSIRRIAHVTMCLLALSLCGVMFMCVKLERLDQRAAAMEDRLRTVEKQALRISATINSATVFHGAHGTFRVAVPPVTE